PTAVADEMEDFIVVARKARPRWGRRKLRAWLVDRHPGRAFPSASCFGQILKRRGLSQPRRRRRRHAVPLSQPFAACDRPKAVWWLRLGIRLERITPGKPQQNGRQERFHLTLQLDVPREALRQKPPATVYHRSPRRYPHPLRSAEPASYCQRAAVNKSGFIR